MEGIDTERASDGDTITDVLLSFCGILGAQEPSLYINPPAEKFAHYVEGIGDELGQARETGRNLVLLASDGGIHRTWLVTDDTAAILQPLAAPQGSPAPGDSAAVSH